MTAVPATAASPPIPAEDPSTSVRRPAAPSPKERREIVVGRWRLPVVVPKRSDPRLKLSATIVVLTILGETVLRFQLSIPQILVCVLLCAVVDIVLTVQRDHVLAWPASALQTGISVAFIFRAAGERHGDLWSMRGLRYFVVVIVVSLFSKYLLRRNGRHIFNPSNIGIAWGLLLIGPSRVFSEHLWWAPLGIPVVLSMAVIFAGAWWVLRQVHMIPMACAFMGTFMLIVGALALFGRQYVATWHHGPVAGSFYWVTVALSPEVLIFAFFMISDPQTAPKSSLGRVIYGAATAAVAAALIGLQSTEFGIKVALLVSLLVTCALVPSIDAWARRLSERGSGAIAAPRPQPMSAGRRILTGLRNPVVVAVVVIAVAAPVNTILLSRDHSIPMIERGLTTHHVQ